MTQPPVKTRRLFLGTFPPGDVFAPVDKSLETLELRGVTTRRVPAENRHLTWLFLGDVPEDRMPALQASLAGIVSRVTPFELRLEKFSLWPSAKCPRLLVWEGPPQTPAQHFHDALRSGLAIFAAEPETHPVFRPHITLARLKPAKERASGSRAGLPELQRTIAMERLSLMESRLTPEGAIYTSVAEYFLPA